MNDVLIMDESDPALEGQLLALLGQRSLKTEMGDPPSRTAVPIPIDFRQEVEGLLKLGLMTSSAANYYVNVLPLADSRYLPTFGGRPSIVNPILEDDIGTVIKRLRSEEAPIQGWRPTKIIGKGAYGAVTLWEKPRAGGRTLKLARKDTNASTFFRDYCTEGHLTRRLNDVGCRNVISVVEFGVFKNGPLNEETRNRGSLPPRIRICYEYAEFRNLQRLQSWYKKHELVLPEAFIWHILYSMANALAFCRHGTNQGTDKHWDTIVHGDIKQCNILLAAPEDGSNPLYPTLKLADFGLAFTLGGPVLDVQQFRSSLTCGTNGYIAPEILDKTPEQEGRRRKPYELTGPHSDIFSLGITCKQLTSLADAHQTSFYSLELRNLIEQCMAANPKNRPKTSRLLHSTEEKARQYQREAILEAAAATHVCNARFYPSQVLYTREEQERFEKEETFRSHYSRANLARVWAAKASQDGANSPEDRAAGKKEGGGRRLLALFKKLLVR